MMRFRSTVVGVALALFLGGLLTGPDALEAQAPDGRRWSLQPRPPGGYQLIIPFMEGWYENEDGTYTISFGYRNQQREVVQIPVGEDNFIEMAEFDGRQPTTFLPGRQRGVFTVTLSAEMKDEDVWWNIRNANGELARVPGRTRFDAYELDWNPRPQGSRHPLVSFESNGEEGRGPPGITAERTQTVSVGTPLALWVNARDPSERDPEDHRFAETVPLRVVWFSFQGPGEVEFTRHDSTPVPEVEEETPAQAAARAAGFPRRRPGPETISLPDGHGVARVMATFSEPGEYVLRVQVDNFRAPDSSSGDQCCWTNGYVRVTVTG